jgi:hypothetical protein
MDVGQAVFRRFGMWAVAAAIAGGIAVWILAHYAAAPGSPVSVLWGLVQYTKQSPTAQTPQTPVAAAKDIGPTSNPGNSGVDPKAGLVQLVGHGYSEATYSQRQSDLRERRGLRELSELESGKPLSSMPKGTFAFVDITDVLIRTSSDVSAFGSVSVRRFAAPDRFDEYPFEIHALDGDDRLLLGFATESGAATVASDALKQVTLSARPRGNLTTLLAVSIVKINRVASRLVEASATTHYLVLDLDLK